MEANELRLGNYIQLPDGVIVKVTSVEKDRVHFSINGCYFFRMISDIEPIELTEEILLKCGFKKYDNGNCMLDDFRLYFDSERKEYAILWFDSLRYTTIKTLHHLQNIYYDLTGEELEINL